VRRGPSRRHGRSWRRSSRCCRMTLPGAHDERCSVRLHPIRFAILRRKLSGRNGSRLWSIRHFRGSARRAQPPLGLCRHVLAGPVMGMPGCRLAWSTREDRGLSLPQGGLPKKTRMALFSARPRDHEQFMFFLTSLLTVGWGGIVSCRC
jgi:hypothetical protein